MRKLAKWFEEALESYVKLMGHLTGTLNSRTS